MPQKNFKHAASIFFDRPTDYTDNAHNTDNTYTDNLYTDNTDNTHNTDNTDYTDNAHMAPPTKNRRVNLLLYPSIHDNMKKLAYSRQTSLNDLVNQALQAFIELNAAELTQYNAFLHEKDGTKNKNAGRRPPAD